MGMAESARSACRVLANQRNEIGNGNGLSCSGEAKLEIEIAKNWQTFVETSKLIEKPTFHKHRADRGRVLLEQQ